MIFFFASKCISMTKECPTTWLSFSSTCVYISFHVRFQSDTIIKTYLLRFPNFLIRFASPTYKIRPSTTLLDRQKVPRCDTSGFRCGVLGTFASPACYAACVGSCLPSFRDSLWIPSRAELSGPFQMEMIRCPETSVDYQPTQQKRRPHHECITCFFPPTWQISSESTLY